MSVDSEPIAIAPVHGLAIEVEAPYLAEMVRAHMEETYGDDAYTGGYKVWTTIDGRLQRAAIAALRQTLLEYDARHGFRKPERHLATDASWTAVGATAGHAGSGSARTLVRHWGRGRRHPREHGRRAARQARA